MSVIELQGMEFFAYHGHHDAERVTGNKYGIDLVISTDLSVPSESDALKDTIDYETIYKIVKEEMGKPAHLLEHLSHRINLGILRGFPEINSVKSRVSKYNPPLGGICHRALVETESFQD
jgi:7,8-dihydroneopterin aldolase/epimerase/oxygenase